MKYACIAQHRHVFPVARMCRRLGVSRSGFYAAQTRQPSARAHCDQRLQLDIHAIYQHSRQTYGSPRMHAEWQAQGVRCGRKRVERLMRVRGMRAKVQRRTQRTTHSQHTYPVAPNHLARQFGVAEIARCDQVRAGDIPYVPTREGWLYLAGILDLASRRVVGWAMRPTLEGTLVGQARQMALAQRRPTRAVLHH